MGHDQNGLTQVGVEPFHQVQHFLGILVVQGAGGFVRHQQIGISHNGPGDGHALFFAAAELTRIVEHPVLEIHQGENFLHPVPTLSP